MNPVWGGNEKLSRRSGMWLGLWWGGSRGVGDYFKWGSQGRPDGKSDEGVDLSEMRGMSM